MPFDCTLQLADDTVIVSPEGDIDIHTAAAVRGVLREVVTSRVGGRIVVDLSDVTFLDSAGIGVFVAAKRAADAQGIPLRLRNPGPVVRMVLEVTKLLGELVEEPVPVPH
ncbi:anti-sigma B factor antagonist [Krasilnikovia cinnamomea]|uniref:Anti-sigma factor antagonist n=1 Tax=Krasilnikovia cinnamomea TaxID=349313 RepID=A0A4Q7ZMZ4_9ACTN|nr:STAS domain-containing protein [Krasilnikovia cinnamomea]RZU51803.1 anti-sigma B factor antagonist [Krasilnikovia cinnamomea]